MSRLGVLSRTWRLSYNSRFCSSAVLLAGGITVFEGDLSALRVESCGDDPR